MGAKEDKELYEAIVKHTDKSKHGPYTTALSSPDKFTEFLDGASSTDRKGLAVVVDKAVTPDGATGGRFTKAFGGYDSARRKTEIEGLFTAADVVERRHSAPPHVKGQKTQVKSDAGDLGVSGDKLAKANERDTVAEMKAEANKRKAEANKADANAILNAGAAYSDAQQEVANVAQARADANEILNAGAAYSEAQEKAVERENPFKAAAKKARDNKSNIEDKNEALEKVMKDNQAKLVKNTPAQKRNELAGKGNKIFKEAVSKIIVKSRKGFKDVVSANKSHTAKKVEAFEEMVRTGTTGPALSEALKEVHLTPKGISRLEDKFKGRADVLGPIYKKALEQDIDNDTITSGKLKKYSQVVNLNDITIAGAPVMNYAGVVASANDRPHMIGQLAKAGVDVNTKFLGASALQHAIGESPNGKNNVANALLYSGANPAGIDTSKIGDEKLKKTTEFLQMNVSESKKQGTMLKSVGFDVGKKAYNASVTTHNKANQSKEAAQKTALGTKDTAKATKVGAIKLAKDTKAAVMTGVRVGKKVVKGVGMGLFATVGAVVVAAVGAPSWVVARSAAATVRLMEDKSKSVGRGGKEYFSPTISNFKNDLKVLQSYEKVVLANNPQAKAFFNDFDNKTNALAKAVKEGADKKVVDGLVEGISTLASHASKSFSIDEKTSARIEQLASGVIEKATEAKKVYDNINHRGNINKDQLTSEIRDTHNDKLYDYTIGKVYNATVAPVVKAVSNIKLPKLRNEKVADAAVSGGDVTKPMHAAAPSKAKKGEKTR